MDRLVETWEENGEMYTSVVAFGEIKDRLAAYEDTGLMPENISAMQTENATLKKALELACHQAGAIRDCPVSCMNIARTESWCGECSGEKAAKCWEDYFMQKAGEADA